MALTVFLVDHAAAIGCEANDLSKQIEHLPQSNLLLGLHNIE